MHIFTVLNEERKLNFLLESIKLKKLLLDELVIKENDLRAKTCLAWFSL